MVMLCGIPGGGHTKEVPKTHAHHSLFILRHGLHELQQAGLIRDGSAIILLAQILTVHITSGILIEGCQVDTIDAADIAAVLLTDIGSHCLREVIGECSLQTGIGIVVKIG